MGVIMNIGLIILMVIGCAAGLLSTLYLTLSIPVILAYKIFRKIRYGISVMN